MTLTLPLPPTVNHLHTVARGRKIKSQTGRDYANTVSDHVTEWRLTTRPTWEPRGGERIRAKAVFYPKDYRRVDIDNYAKALLDSVFACFEDADDCQVDVLTLKRMPPDKHNPRVVLTLEAI